MIELEIKNNTANHHFETVIEGQTAFIDYQLRADALVVFHTQVPKQLEGQGIAAALTKYVLDYATTEQLGVIPLCPYMAAYLKKHPEYQHLVRKIR